MGFLNLMSAMSVSDVTLIGTVVVIAILGILVTAEVLLSQLPQTLRARMDRNCIRMDGSRSQRRAAIEHQNLQRLRIELYGVLAIPAAIAAALLLALPLYFPVAGLWQTDPVPATHNPSPTQLEKIGIPIAFAAALSVLACWYMVLSGYKRLLRRLQRKIDQRYKAYLRLDLDLN